MAAGLIVVALLACIPTLPAWRPSGTDPLPLWALGLALASLLQVIYAAYMTLWPAAASLLTTAVVGLSMTGGYALLLVTRLLVDDRHAWVRAWQLDINSFSPNQEAGWCFVMLLLTGMWSYFAGRAGLIWMRWEREA